MLRKLKTVGTNKVKIVTEKGKKIFYFRFNLVGSPVATWKSEKYTLKEYKKYTRRI